MSALRDLFMAQQMTRNAYMFTERTEPVAFRNDHDRRTQARRVVPSIAPITQQYLQ